MAKLINATPLAGYRLRLEYDDGEIGDIDLSSMVGKGVFTAWNDVEVFESVSIGEHGELRWTEDLELCADAQYLKMTGKSAEDLFPNLRVHVDA